MKSDIAIIDSAMTRDEVLAQNPTSIAPVGILEKIIILEVDYIGYDDVLHRGQIAVQQDVVEDVLSFFTLARRLSFPIEKLVPISNAKYSWDDETSCADNNSSGYNYRTVHGTNRLSKHAQGFAFDINPAQNIYVTYNEQGEETYRSPKDGVYDEQAKGTLTKNHPLVLHMKGLGWTWGGDLTKKEGRVDYQHFEKPY